MITITPLARISTPGGDVMHAMKSIDNGFAGFGEAYFSWVDEAAVKAWKRHTRMVMNVVVPVGQVRFVFSIDGCNFRVEEIGNSRYARLTVPPGIWFGFQGVDAPANLVLNLASITHDPTEVERKTINEINYSW